MSATFQGLSGVDRFFNRLLGALASRGMAPGYMHELIVRGRKSGRLYTTPVKLIERGGKSCLVAPRGRTQGGRNAEAAGEVELKRGAQRKTYAIRTTSIEERPPLLKLYLDKFPSQVQRFFSVRAGAPVSEFAAVAEDHPVYELIPK